MVIYFDASTLISLALTCNLPYLEKLERLYHEGFAITSTVFNESITKAMHIERFKYEAFRVKKLIDEGVLKVYDDSKYKGRINELMNLMNSCFFAHSKPLKIVQSGEVSIIPFAKKNDALAIDERTIRYFIESPEKLRGLLEHRLHTRVTSDKRKLNDLKQQLKHLNVIRSTELAMVAYEKGYVGRKNRELFNGLLWALKLNGCAISSGEIKKYVRRYG
jgi:hypothetical protein